MRTLLVAVVSAIGMGTIGAAGVSAMPIDASAVQEAAAVNSAVSPVGYYVYRHRYYRPYYRYYRPYYYHRYGW